MKLNKKTKKKYKNLNDRNFPIYPITKIVKEKSNYIPDETYIWKLTNDVYNYIQQRIRDSEQLAWYDDCKPILKGEYIDFLQNFEYDKMNNMDTIRYYGTYFTGKEHWITGKGENVKWFNKMAIYLTDTCNMNCIGCGVKNRTNKGRLGYKEWRSILKTCKDVTDFIVIFGGEPTSSRNLESVIKYLNKINLSYAIVTNGKRLVKYDDYFNKFMSWKPKNVTFSINHYNKLKVPKTDFFEKTIYGYKLLNKLEKNNYNEDITANFTINKYTYKHLYEMIKEFSDRNVWSILTPFHSMKGYFTDDGVDDLVVPYTSAFYQTNDDLNKQLDLLIKNYDDLLIHAPKEWLIWAKDNVLKFDWKCDYEHVNYAAIDSTGCIQYCHNIEPSNLKFIDYVDGRQKFENKYKDKNSVAYKEFMKKSKRQLRNCSGCSLDHSWSSDYYSRNNLKEQGKKDFMHIR